MSRAKLRRFPMALTVMSVFLGAICLLIAPRAGAEIITLNNGVQIDGRHAMVSKVGKDPFNVGAGGASIKPIVLMDDEMRRVFFHNGMVRGQPQPSNATGTERFILDKRVAKSGRRVVSIGPILGITPWDILGNRTFSMLGSKGRIDIVQGITELTPRYCKVEALQTQNSHIWEMPIPTSSIPRAVLSKILLNSIDTKNANDRLRIVRFYTEADRFKDALEELQAAMRDFPVLAEFKKQEKVLYQMKAQKALKEIDLRLDSGQFGLAYFMLNNFPVEGIAQETQLQVRQKLDDFDKQKNLGEKALKLLKEHLAAIDDPALKNRLELVCNEIANDLNANNLPRMADYLRLSDDEKLNADQKLSLAISGWLLGSGQGTENIGVAASLYEVRGLVETYLNTDTQPERDEIIQKLRDLEGGTPAYLARLIEQMKPAIDSSELQKEIPGLFEIAVPGLEGEPDFEYYIQLPPEYDPYRRYPCVVTLNGSAVNELQQIDWWAGGFDKASKMRLGQASRRGYIVIAPKWSKVHQRKYEYTAQEHAAVLYSLRDAERRFSIDVDRVFLSGHSMGGDAVWDIALAHPDLWAGVIPIVASADKYVSRYWKNAKGLPLYFVSGGMDAGMASKNSRDLNRYLTQFRYKAMLIEYKGRGHEHFQDEIQNIFDWMKFYNRDFYPKEFECYSMRPWDNYFWWVELSRFPKNSMVNPLAWPPVGRVKPAKTEAKILNNNHLRIRTAANHVTVWLSPEVISFEERITITVNGKSRKENIAPDIEILLEDVRTRGDRQHPFWAKFQTN